MLSCFVRIYDNVIRNITSLLFLSAKFLIKSKHKFCTWMDAYSYFTTRYSNLLYSIFYIKNIDEDKAEVCLSILWRLAVYYEIWKPVKGGGYCSFPENNNRRKCSTNFYMYQLKDGEWHISTETFINVDCSIPQRSEDRDLIALPQLWHKKGSKITLWNWFESASCPIQIQSGRPFWTTGWDRQTAAMLLLYFSSEHLLSADTQT